VIIILAVYLNEAEPSINSDKQCDLDSSLICRFKSANPQAMQVIVKFAKKVQVEEQNEVILILDPNVMVENIWVQGINMYMGKVAVFEKAAFDSKPFEINQRHLQFFLGSCSETKMRWQMVLQLKKVSRLSDIAQSETYFVNFKTEVF
ncbi:hypothetical protein, partial [Paraglaciecola hydrolytica]